MDIYVIAFSIRRFDVSFIFFIFFFIFFFIIFFYCCLDVHVLLLYNFFKLFIKKINIKKLLLIIRESRGPSPVCRS